MKQFVWIPVAGTALALIAILLAHPEREGAGPVMPADPGDAFEDVLPPPDEDDEPEEEPPAPPPEEAQTYTIRLLEDGTFEETGSTQTYKNVDEVLEDVAAGGARPTILLLNAAGVAREDFDAAAATLRERCTVRTSYRE